MNIDYEEKWQLLRKRLKSLDGSTDFDYAQDWTERRMEQAKTPRQKYKVLKSYFKLIRLDDK